MALKPRDRIHKAQITAGITGRKRGHEFERALTAKINLLITSFQQSITPAKGKHVFNGIPEELLIFYIWQIKAYKKLQKFRAFSLGGHATGEGGCEYLLENGEALKRAKSDVLIEIEADNSIEHIGVSVKTCSKKSPTNDQLFCSTADAFCNLLVENEINVPDIARQGLKMFCGDKGLRPLDLSPNSKRINSERWFWEEIPKEAIELWTNIFNNNQAKITELLLCKGYSNDPIPPQFIFHQTVAYDDWNKMEVALFSVEELIQLSCQYSPFTTSSYFVRKGRFKDPSTPHLAPRFGLIQFQRLGNKQNATQLQFNLQAGYFYKLSLEDES